MSDKVITIPLEYAKNIHKVLEDFERFGMSIVSQEIKDIVSEDAYNRLIYLYTQYHNANCGPFNRTLKRLIDTKEQEQADE